MFDGVIACPRCGMVGGRTDRFCRYCGESMSKNGTVREYRHITALFSDLSDYTPLTEELDPEELKDLLDALFTKAITIITSYGGMVEKFVGDGIIALFGLDRVHEHDSVRAINAAVEIHCHARELEGTTPCLGGRSLSMHTGINTGFVLVDQTSQAPFSHGVLGTPINIASRLSSMAGADEIFITEPVKINAERYFSMGNMGMKSVKGLKYPVNVFTVLSARKIPVPIHRHGGTTSDMIGRQDELGVLASELERIADGGISSVCLCGDPGVGKSRLIEEFRLRVAPQVRWIGAQCLDYTKDTPYYPIAFLLRGILEEKEFSGIDDVKQAVSASIGERPSSTSADSLFAPEQDTEDLTPDARKARFLDAAASLILSAGKDRQLILCIEDIHWADRSTLDVLEYILRHENGSCSCLFIISSRTKINFSGPGVQISLKDLTPEETGRMTEYMLGSGNVPETTRQYLYRETGGNPFYIEEVVNFLLEKGASMSLRAGISVDEGVPSTIQGLVAARMENLGQGMKKILQEASVIGRIFPVTLLKAVSSPDIDVDGCLNGLDKAGFIHSTGADEYSFRHALTRDVAYETLLRQDRMKMHKRTGCVLEATCSNAHEICDMLAYHFDLAGEAGSAIRYSIMAARKYQADGSWVEAASHYRTAEKYLSADGMSQEGREQLPSVWEGIWSCSRIFSPKQAERALEKLSRHYASSGLFREEAFALIRLINLYSQKGQFDKALATFDHTASLAGNDEVLRSAAMTAVAYTCTYLGEQDRALAYLEKARPPLDLPDRFLLAVNHLTTLAAYVWKGSIPHAMVWYDLTKRVSGAYMDLEIMADTYLGYLYCLGGSFTRALQVFERVALEERKLGSLAGGLSYLRIQSSIYFNARYTGNLDTARSDLRTFTAHDGGMRWSPALCDLYHAWIELEEGRYEQALTLLVKLPQVFKKGIANRVPYALNALAETLYNLGDMKKAAETVRQGIEWNERYGNQDQLVWALRIMGDICIAQQRLPMASNVLKNASSLARKHSLKPHTAWTLKSWGDYFLRKGNEKASSACFRRARSLWLEMDNPYQAGKLCSGCKS